MRPQWRAPLGFSKIDRHRQTLKLCRKKAPVAGHHRSACSGVKALRNTSDARRQAAKLCYRFGPLTPSARSANLIAGDGTKNGFPAPNKEPAKTKNHHLTGKAPYKFESISLQRGVCCEPAPLHQGARPANRSEVTGDRQAALQPDQRKVDSEAPCVRSAGPRPRDDPNSARIVLQRQFPPRSSLRNLVETWYQATPVAHRKPATPFGTDDFRDTAANRR